MNTEFSVVIPFFDAEETLAETLDSVSAQTYGNFEVILVNDGSTDASRKIASQWREEQPFPVKLLDQQNAGQAAARNAGIAKAKKEWIAFLDADDLWEPKKLETLNENLDPSADVVYHQIKTFGADTDRVRKGYQLKNIPQFLERGNPVTPSAAVVRKEVLQEFNFNEDPKYQGVEDAELWLRLLKADHRFQHIPEPLTLYREEGGISSKLEEHLARNFRMLEDLYNQDFFTQKDLAVAKRRKYLEAARFYQKRKQFDQAHRFYQAADFKSAKVFGLRFLNFFGIKI